MNAPPPTTNAPHRPLPTERDAAETPRWLYNPYEVAFCGYAGSGKTTLITRLIAQWNKDQVLGYVKHTSHGFDLDRTGKDSQRAASSGAQLIRLESPTRSAILRTNPADPFHDRTALLDADAVFIEGYKDTDVAKVLLLDEDGKVLEAIRNKRFRGVFAVAGTRATCPELAGLMPYFHREDLAGIQRAVRAQLARQIALRPLRGLILAGGMSRRMGRDKALRTYHGRTQIEHCFELLAPCTEHVHLSCRSEQGERSGYTGWPHIYDRFLDIGPMGGVLSALREAPHAAWLVLACDMPWVTSDTLAKLVRSRNPYRYATAFCRADPPIPEPLCTIYEPKSIHRLLERLAAGQTSLRRMLNQVPVQRLPAPTSNVLDDVDEAADTTAPSLSDK